MRTTLAIDDRLLMAAKARAAAAGETLGAYVEEALRLRLQNNLIDARDSAVGMGVPMTRANQAAWFVAALIDDIALNTPWGGHSGWPRQPLVVGLSGEVDRVYALAEIGRDAALADAKTQAIEAAVSAGASRDSIEIVDVEDVPLAYLPGYATRVRVKAVGELHVA